MPQPTNRDVHVDRMLTMLSLGYTNQAYIADRLFPIVRVKKQSDLLLEYDQSHWFRDSARQRLSGSKSHRGGYTVNRDTTYFCKRYSFGREIDDEIRSNVDEPINLDQEATNFVTDKLQMRREVNFASTYFTTGKWTDVVGGTDFTKWSDYGGSTPLVDISNYNDAIEGRIGREGNTLAMGKQVWLQLKWHPDVIDTIKYTQRGVMTVDLFASLVDLAVDRVLIGRAIYTTSVEGTAESSVTYSRIWGKNALLLYVPPAPSLMTPSAGYTFVWEVVPNAIQYIKRMRDEEKEIDIIEGNSYFDQRLTGARAGEFLSAAVA